MSNFHRFRIRQNGATTALAEGIDRDEAEADILRMALEHRKKGPLTVQKHTGTYWKRHALFEAWPNMTGSAPA